MRVLAFTHTNRWHCYRYAAEREDGVGIKAHDDVAVGGSLTDNIRAAFDAAVKHKNGHLAEVEVIDLEANFGIPGHEVADEEARAVLREISVRCPALKALSVYSGSGGNFAGYERVMGETEFSGLHGKIKFYDKSCASPTIAAIRVSKNSRDVRASLGARRANRPMRQAARAQRAASRQSSRRSSGASSEVVLAQEQSGGGLERLKHVVSMRAIGDAETSSGNVTPSSTGMVSIASLRGESPLLPAARAVAPRVDVAHACSGAGGWVLEEVESASEAASEAVAVPAAASVEQRPKITRAQAAAQREARTKYLAQEVKGFRGALSAWRYFTGRPEPEAAEAAKSAETTLAP